MDLIPLSKPLVGPNGLVVGIANEHSIAYGCAQVLRAVGAELAVTWLNEKARPHVEALARELAAAITMALDVERLGAMESVFAAIRARCGGLDNGHPLRPSPDDLADNSAHWMRLRSPQLSFRRLYGSQHRT